jgi:hypothetical protein
MINKEQKYELFSKFSDNMLTEYRKKLIDLYYGRAKLGCCGVCHFLSKQYRTDEKPDSYDLVCDYMKIMEIKIDSYGVMDEARTELVISLIFDIHWYLANKL